MEMLREKNESYKPKLDIAIDVLSGGKAKLHNQSHSNFAKFIRKQVEHNQGRTEDDLKQAVERLMPGCFSIGPECESLGITGDLLFDDKATIPERINPGQITNRVLFEMSQYLARMKQNYDDMAKWLKKIIQLKGDQELTSDMVHTWCSTVNKESARKKRQSMSQAQQYLAEKFKFPPALLQSISDDAEKRKSPASDRPKTDEKVENENDMDENAEAK